jgi:hypothetical protein
MTRATEHGLRLTKPWGDSAPYDFAVDHHGHFLRVQVKCTFQKRENNSYRCCIGQNGVPYDPSELDFFAAYVMPADAWYILPLAATHRQPDILTNPSPCFLLVPLLLVPPTHPPQPHRQNHRGRAALPAPRKPSQWNPGFSPGERICELDFFAAYVIPADAWYILPWRPLPTRHPPLPPPKEIKIRPISRSLAPADETSLRL